MMTPRERQAPGDSPVPAVPLSSLAFSMPLAPDPAAARRPHDPPRSRLRHHPGTHADPEPDPVRLVNPGIPFDPDWIREVRINPSAVDRRVATLTSGRRPKQHWKAAWLLKAISLMDLTTLSSDDTPARVRRMCRKALQPLRSGLATSLGLEPGSITPAAVCVFHAFVPVAARAVGDRGIPVAAVSTGFPHGLSPLSVRLSEIEASVQAGAGEIDAVITRSLALTGNWARLHQEIRAFREACGTAHLKVILATGELGSPTCIARASLVAMMAGADFIKTSTGKEAVNATLPVGLVMARQIRSYRERTGVDVGLKAAGGIRTAREAVDWMMLVREELGRRWLEPERFRFGASSLLTDLQRQLEHHVHVGSSIAPPSQDS